ncbi:MAG: excinuclease ABC subunit UvrC [Oscillospiraceae bacterium]|jgi:excinuclease ABC subunit C|nr:excinuclease ABC subunit UvrC [Oscillospiraceae bacterium]
MNENLKNLRTKAMRLPLLPGVYLMQDKKRDVIYVGKAKVLKNRVSQYFGSPNGHDNKVRAMVENVADFDYIVVGSEFEAFVLECSLIKQHQPRYNILLKDGKGYRYIRVSNEEYPRLGVAMQKQDDGARYLGPYTSGYAVKLAVEEVSQVFQLPQCAKQFPRDIGKGRPCLLYSIKRCSAPCARKISQGDYAKSVADAVDFLQGGSGKAMQTMRNQMQYAADNLDFERAAKLRDRIRSFEKIQEKQHVVSVNVEEQDVFALASEQNTSCFMVLRFTEGRLFDSEHFMIDRPEDFAEARRELLERFYTMRGDRFPKRILLDGETNDMDLLAQWLRERAGYKVHILIPQKGEPLQLAQLCAANAIEQLAHRTGRQSKTIQALEELARLLGLPNSPAVIEAYDISHTGGADNVGGMVVFKDGVPYKAGYKRFRIKSVDGQDDYASMAEMLTRRLRHASDGVDSGFSMLPDLILLDGGIGQIHAAQPVLRQFGLDIPLFGMVKDNRHRTRAIASGGEDGAKEIAFTSAQAAFRLATQIQDEVHRFAIAYHHKAHQKRSLHSTLTDIDGIGETRAKALLGELKTMKAIREASVETLAAVNGMNRVAAERLFAALRS